jgi:hypothetical protein
MLVLSLKPMLKLMLNPTLNLVLNMKSHLMSTFAPRKCPKLEKTKHYNFLLKSALITSVLLLCHLVHNYALPLDTICLHFVQSNLLQTTLSMLVEAPLRVVVICVAQKNFFLQTHFLQFILKSFNNINSLFNKIALSCAIFNGYAISFM